MFLLISNDLISEPCCAGYMYFFPFFSLCISFGIAYGLQLMKCILLSHFDWESHYISFVILFFKKNAVSSGKSEQQAGAWIP